MNWFKKIFAGENKWEPDQETVELIKKLYNPELGDEHSLAGVSRTIGVQPKKLKHWLKKNNLYQEAGSYYDGWRPKDESEGNLIKQLYLLPPEGQGKTLGQISKIINTPEHKLRTWLKNQKLYRYSNNKNTFNPSEEMKEKIKKWYMLPPNGDGFGIKTIAKKIGISGLALRNWFDREGIELRNMTEQRNTPYQKENSQKKMREWGKTQRLLSEDDVDYLVFLYTKEGYSTFDIADAFGIDSVTAWEYLKRRNVKTRTSTEATKLEKSRQKSRKDTLEYWKTHDFWERMATHPLNKRYDIISGIAKKIYFANDLEKSKWIGAMMGKARKIEDNTYPALTVHAPYDRGNEVEGNVTSSINMNWFKQSQREIWQMPSDSKEYADLDIDLLDRMSFGFSENDIKRMSPKNLKIKWKEDMNNVIFEQKKSGKTKEQWAKTINLSEPIDVIFENGVFKINDGHHRYYAALILGKDLNVSLTIVDKPHRYAVEKALKEGKNVPMSVLKDYPDLMRMKNELV